MLDNIKNVLKKLEIEDLGRYDNHFYILDLADSNEYAKMYTKLSNNATNTEYPYLDFDKKKLTTGITNYFELDLENLVYNIFLVGDFDKDKYYVKIGER